VSKLARALSAQILPLLLLLAVGCSEDTIVDIIPPNPPVASLLRASGPAAQGKVTVSGETGAVEGDATVEVYNQNPGVDEIVTGSAAGNGSFSVQIEGGYFDRFGVSAIDAAGNRSTTSYVTSGAPFTLRAIGGGGQTGVVTNALPLLLVFRVEDGFGDPVEGIGVEFLLSAGEGEFSPAEATSDASGEVSTELTLGETAGELIVEPAGTELSFDTVETLSATAEAGPPAALVWIEGSGQKDGPGNTLLVPLVVQVQDAYGNGVTGVAITLDASAHGGSTTPGGGDSDSGGLLVCHWTLGPANGVQSLLAQSAGLADAVASAEADDQPTITNINPDPAVLDPLELLDVYGDNFCETDQYNSLVLTGVVADVVELEVVQAEEDHLKARIPAGTGAGLYTLSLSVGQQAAPETFPVEIALPLGEVVDYSFGSAGTDVEIVVPSASSSYALIPYSSKYWEPEYPYEYSYYSYSIGAGALPTPSSPLREENPAEAFHRRLLSPRPSGPPPLALPATRGGGISARETFLCLNDPYASVSDPGAYTSVTANLRYTGQHTLIYVDVDTPEANLPQARIDEIGARFDDVDHDTDVMHFGAETDIDSNGKVMVLLSPVVNALSSTSDGSWYIGGFFNPADLDVWWSTPGISNHGEIFYAIVPDPTGQWSPIHHPVLATVAAIKSILAHEFQHMINMGQRHLIQGNLNTPQEELWLNEGLSHLAEGFCGYDDQNTARVKLYLHGDGPSLTSLVQGPANLAERGASYLFCRYLEDRWNGTSLDLIGGPEAGPANVAQAIAGAGLDFDQVFKDWAAAIYLDDRDLDGDGTPEDLGPAYRFTSHNLRTDFPPQGGSESLSIPTLHFHDPIMNGSLAPTGLDYLHIDVANGQSPPPGGTATLSFSGSDFAEMGVLVIRRTH